MHYIRFMASKPLRILALIEPLSTISPKTDTTYALYVAAQKRGHALFIATPEDLRVRETGALRILATPVSIAAPGAPMLASGAALVQAGDAFDVVLIRHDPPYNMRYLTATYLLELLPPKTLVLNNPKAIRDCPEKLLPLRFPGLLPPTLISRSKEAIEAFWHEQGKMVLKPLYSCGGDGVVVLEPNDPNFTSIVELLSRSYPEPLIAQRYLPEIRQGDKRILLLDGEPIGAVARVPAADEVRANLHVGGTATATELTPRDREICSTLKPFLQEHGLLFVGIDVIGSYLTEINVTSPTGLQEITALTGRDIGGDIWTTLEAKHRQI